MSTRLIIEGNAVYEIDEECRGCGRIYREGQISIKEPEEEKDQKKGRLTVVFRCFFSGPKFSGVVSLNSKNKPMPMHRCEQV